MCCCSASTAEIRKTVEDVVAGYPSPTGSILGILEELQERHPQKYLPRETLALVAEVTGVSPAQIYSVVTFYAFFNLKPQGRHTIMVCRGTACHTRGSKTLLDQLLRSAGHAAGAAGEEGEGAVETFTTPDHRLTVRTVACFGQCALAPVIGVDEDIYGYMNELKLKEVLQGLEGQGGQS